MNEKLFDFVFEFIPIVTALIGIYGAYHISQRKEKLEIMKKRYYELVFPIFDLLDPYLFSVKCNLSIIKKIEVILNKEGNRAIAGRPLIYAIELCKKSNNIKNCEKLYKIIAKDHDNLCFYLHIPTRNGNYKLMRTQFSSWVDYARNWLYYKIFLPICYGAFIISFVMFVLATLRIIF